MATHPRKNFPNPQIADGSTILPITDPGRDVNARLAWFDAKRPVRVVADQQAGGNL